MNEAASGSDVPFYFIAANLDLIADRDALIHAIRVELGSICPAAVVIDTLNRSLNGSESKDEDMARYLRAANAIIEAFDCLVAIVHHSGVDTSRPRGHTSLVGAADVQIKIERDALGNIVACVEWMKDGPEGERFVSQLKPVEVGVDEDGEMIASCIVVPVDGTPNRATGEARRVDQGREDRPQGSARGPSRKPVSLLPLPTMFLPTSRSPRSPNGATTPTAWGSRLRKRPARVSRPSSEPRNISSLRVRRGRLGSLRLGGEMSRRTGEANNEHPLRDMFVFVRLRNTARTPRTMFADVRFVRQAPPLVSRSGGINSTNDLRPAR